MNSKTPVTLLQEFLSKRRSTPDYVLVHNGVGTHSPLFVYEVSGLGQTAVGRGKSKREAKHAAAQELLYAIKVCERIGDDELEEAQSPYADVLKDNAVQILLEFCRSHKIKPPTYEQTRDEGLPHAKLFGMRCRNSNLSTVAEAPTKKQAKQIASHLMLLKLKECLNDKTLSEHLIEKKNEQVNDHLDRLIADKVNIALEHENRTSQAEALGIPLDLYDEFLKSEAFRCSELLEELKISDANFFTDHPHSLSMFVELMKQMKLEWNQLDIPTKPGKDLIISLQIDALNKATFFGRGQDPDSTLQDAALSALKWFKIMAL